MVVHFAWGKHWRRIVNRALSYWRFVANMSQVLRVRNTCSIPILVVVPRPQISVAHISLDEHSSLPPTAHPLLPPQTEWGQPKDTPCNHNIHANNIMHNVMYTCKRRKLKISHSKIIREANKGSLSLWNLVAVSQICIITRHIIIAIILDIESRL